MRVTPKRLVSLLVPYLSAILAAGVLTAPGARAADLPTRDEVRAAIDRGAPSTAFFWSGRDQWDRSVAPQAERIAVARGGDGETLAMRLTAEGVRLPAPDDHSPEAAEFWNFASREFASRAVGKVWFVRGATLRPNNVWETIEFPTLTANPKVTCVFRIDINTPSEENLVHGDPTRCEEERVLDQAKATCGIWRDAGWPRAAPPNRVTTTVASTGRNPDDTRKLIGGGIAPPWVTGVRTYSVDPVPALSAADDSRWIGGHARLDVHFTHSTGTSVAHTLVRDRQGKILDDDFTCPPTSTRSDL